MCVASRLGRRPKRLKEMHLAVADAVVGGGNTSATSCSSSADQHLEISAAAVRGLSMSSSTLNSSLGVADVHAELQVHFFSSTLLHCITNRLIEHIISLSLPGFSFLPKTRCFFID